MNEILDKYYPSFIYLHSAEFCLIFRSFFGVWSFKKKCFWDLLTFTGTHMAFKTWWWHQHNLLHPVGIGLRVQTYPCPQARLYYNALNSNLLKSSDAGTGGGQGGPPIFSRSVNPIRTGEGRLSPPITTGTPQSFSPSGTTEKSTYWKKKS